MIKVTCRIIIPMVLLLFAVACGKRLEDRRDSDAVIVKFQDSLTFCNRDLENFVKAYVAQDSADPGSRVYKLQVEEKDFNLCLTINSVNNQQILFDDFILGYFVVNDHVVVISQRLERILKPKMAFKTELLDLIHRKVGDDFFDSLVSTYDPPVWQLVINQDSTFTNRQARSPDIPTREVIEVQPPKIE